MERSLNSFEPTLLVIPKSPSRGHQDDVSAQHYVPPPLSYMSTQRKGVRGPIPSAKSYKDHLAQALEQPFPMAADCPLPEDVLDAVKFLTRSSDRAITGFWSDQLPALTKLAAHPLCFPNHWYDLRPAELSSSPKALEIALISQLSAFAGIGALNWISGYIYGFPITGHISQPRTSPHHSETG